MPENTSKKKKIYVIDDDVSIGEILTSILTLEDFDVSTFTKGSAAIEKIKSDSVDLILLDYFLPGEDTVSIIENLRQKNGVSSPIILMSASVQGEQMAKKLPVKEFIPKPFQREVLIETIRRNIL